jgi:hypothetical protein
MTEQHYNPIYTGYKDNKPVNGINVEIRGALTQCAGGSSQRWYAALMN